jgi:hypothetical protein
MVKLASMVRWVIALFLLVYGTVPAQASIQPSELPPLAAQQVRRAIEHYLEQLGNGLHENAENPNVIRPIIHYLREKKVSETMGSAGIVSHGIRARLYQQERFLRIPDPTSHDGRLLQTFLYAHERAKEAQTHVLARMAGRLSPTELNHPERELEDRALMLSHLWEEYAASGQWMTPEYRKELQSKLVRGFEDLLFWLPLLAPADYERIAFFVASSAVDFTLILAGLSVSGNNPQNLGAWLGIALSGAAFKMLQAAIEKDLRYLFPFWGAVARSEKWLGRFQRNGLLWSQMRHQAQSFKSAGLSSASWEQIEGLFQNSCGAVLMELASERYTERLGFHRTKWKELALPVE